MNGQPQTSGAYQTDPTPYLAFMAIAAALFVSAPALLLGMLLAPLARRARVAFAGIAIAGAGFIALSWHAISLEMHRAQRAGHRHGMLMHFHDSLKVAWPHIRTWWLLATPLCFAVATGIALAQDDRGAARPRGAPRRSRPAPRRAPSTPQDRARVTSRAASRRSRSASRSPATTSCRPHGEAA